jgi:hypothetical protein
MSTPNDLSTMFVHVDDFFGLTNRPRGFRGKKPCVDERGKRFLSRKGIAGLTNLPRESDFFHAFSTWKTGASAFHSTHPYRGARGMCEKAQWKNKNERNT